jgi:hypothetical protein
MKPAVHDASARQRSGGPSPVRGRRGNGNGRPPTGEASPGGSRGDRARKPGLTEVETGIAELVDQSTHDLRLAWRRVHRIEPPVGLSRDLLIRALANQLNERAYGGASRALRRHLQTLAGEFEKGGASSDPDILPKTGTTLVRQWRGHAHTVLVREDGFEYEGQRYRSLTVIAERITGAHWSGPRFFGLTNRAGVSVGAEAGR